MTPARQLHDLAAATRPFLPPDDPLKRRRYVHALLLRGAAADVASLLRTTFLSSDALQAQGVAVHRVQVHTG